MDEIIVNGERYIRATPSGKDVIVRTYSAGVHVGTLESLNGTTCVLTNARRLWRWRGANTLNEVATSGIDRAQHSRISNPVPSITLTQACEVIPVSEAVDLSPIWNA